MSGRLCLDTVCISDGDTALKILTSKFLVVMEIIAKRSRGEVTFWDTLCTFLQFQIILSYSTKCSNNGILKVGQYAYLPRNS